MKLAWEPKKPTRPVDRNGHRISTHPELYHSYRWTKLARAFLADHPLCAECSRRGIVTAAQVADHIIPVEIWMGCGGSFYDTSNLQPLCRLCNIAKGNKDKEAIRAYRIANGRGK